MGIEPIEINLEETEKASIARALSLIAYDPMGEEDYINSLRALMYEVIPKRILTIFHRQRTSKSPYPFIVLNNLPIDKNIKGTPSFNETGINFKSGCISENVICLFGLLIGEPYSINFEGRELVNNLTPQMSSSNEYTGLGSNVELDLHIENAALKFMAEDDYSPMGLLLLGLRKEPKNNGPNTYIVDSREAIDLLDKDDLEILARKNYIIRVPYRWRNAFNRQHTELEAIISGPTGWPRLNVAFYPDMVLPVNERAKEALDHLYKAMKVASITIKITPGKLVYVDNRFALHAREKFAASYDENGCPYRWLQRVFVAPNLWSFRGFQTVGARIFEPAI